MLKRDYHVHTTPAAYNRMIEHIIFLALASDTAAGHLYDALCREIGSLNYDPMMYPVYFTQKPIVNDIAFRYKFCPKRHRIVFEVIDEAVYIQDVQDCRQHQNKSLV